MLLPKFTQKYPLIFFDKLDINLIKSLFFAYEFALIQLPYQGKVFDRVGIVL